MLLLKTANSDIAAIFTSHGSSTSTDFSRFRIRMVELIYLIVSIYLFSNPSYICAGRRRLDLVKHAHSKLDMNLGNSSAVSPGFSRQGYAPPP